MAREIIVGHGFMIMDLVEQIITLKMADQENSDFYVVFAALRFASDKL